MTITSTLTAPAPTHHDPTTTDSTPTSHDDVPVFRPTPRPPAVRVSPYGPSEDVPVSDFESAFRRRLAELGAVERELPDTPKRSTVTAVVTALRSAIGVDRLLSVARGLTPQDVADAYDHVERRRGRAVEALDRLVEEPTIDRFDRECDELVAFLPQMVASLRRIATDHAESFAGAVEHLDEQRAVLERSVVAVEQLVRRNDPTWSTKIAELDDGRNRGVYHHVCFVPRRVGELVPVRLAYLMGDARQDETP